MNQPLRTGKKWELIGITGNLLINFLFKTITIESIGLKRVGSLIASRRFILAFWHSRILMFSYLFQNWNGSIMVSRSKDGEIIARVLHRQGHEPIRGSSSRGGLQALARQIRELKAQSRPGVVIPDGPRGPRFVVQPGVILLSQKTGYPIIPASYSAFNLLVFNSWDRFVVPRPFTRCRVVYGNPLWVPPETGKGGIEPYREKLQKELLRITRGVDRYFGHQID